jgi:hypothetical protein
VLLPARRPALGEDRLLPALEVVEKLQNSSTSRANALSRPALRPTRHFRPLEVEMDLYPSTGVTAFRKPHFA